MDPNDAPPPRLDRPATARKLPRSLTAEIPTPSSSLLRSRAAVAVAVVAAVLLTIGAAVEPAWLRRIDESLSESIRGWGAHGFFRVFTNLGSVFPAIALSGAVVVSLWRRCRPMAVAFPSIVVAVVALDLALKVIVRRDRPIGTLVGTALGSFPSGHVIMAVAVLGLLVPALWIATRSRVVFGFTVTLLVGGVSLVAVSRVNLGAHWPSDVAASLLLGMAVLLAAEYVLASEWACDRCNGCGLHPQR